MFTINVKFQKKYLFKYQAQKEGITAGNLKSFFCSNELSPFKLDDVHHYVYKPIEVEEAFISFFHKNMNEIKDDYVFTKDIRIKARLSIGAFFYPFQLDISGKRHTVFVFMMKNTKVKDIAKLFQDKLQLSPIKFKNQRAFNRPETMTPNASINSYEVKKYISIILPDFKTFGFAIMPNKDPIFYLGLSYKTPLKVIMGRVSDEINKRFKIETPLDPHNISLFIKEGRPLVNLAEQLKELKAQSKIISIQIKDAQLPPNPSYLFLFPENSVPQLFELNKDVTVEHFLNEHFSKQGKFASLICNGEKLKKNNKFSELGITMANLIIVKEKGSKIFLTIVLPHRRVQVKFRKCYQLRDLKEKVKEFVGSAPFNLEYKNTILDETKTCRDYGIESNSEIIVQYIKILSQSSTNILEKDSSSISVFDTPVEGNPVIFVAKDMRPSSHTFEKKATVAEAKAFIMKSWNVKKVKLLIGGRFLSDSMKLSKLPISKKFPIVVVIEDKYDGVLQVKTALCAEKPMNTIKQRLICENSGEVVIIDVKANPTIGDVLQALSKKYDVGKKQIDVVYNDKVYKNDSYYLSAIENNEIESDKKSKKSSGKNKIVDSDSYDDEKTMNVIKKKDSADDSIKKKSKISQNSDDSDSSDKEPKRKSYKQIDSSDSDGQPKKKLKQVNESDSEDEKQQKQRQSSGSRKSTDEKNPKKRSRKESDEQQKKTSTDSDDSEEVQTSKKKSRSSKNSDSDSSEEEVTSKPKKKSKSSQNSDSDDEIIKSPKKKSKSSKNSNSDSSEEEIASKSKKKSKSLQYSDDNDDEIIKSPKKKSKSSKNSSSSSEDVQTSKKKSRSSKNSDSDSSEEEVTSKPKKKSKSSQNSDDSEDEIIKSPKKKSKSSKNSNSDSSEEEIASKSKKKSKFLTNSDDSEDEIIKSPKKKSKSSKNSDSDDDIRVIKKSTKSKRQKKTTTESEDSEEEKKPKKQSSTISDDSEDGTPTKKQKKATKSSSSSRESDDSEEIIKKSKKKSKTSHNSDDDNEIEDKTTKKKSKSKNSEDDSSSDNSDENTKKKSKSSKASNNGLSSDDDSKSKKVSSAHKQDTENNLSRRPNIFSSGDLNMKKKIRISSPISDDEDNNSKKKSKQQIDSSDDDEIIRTPKSHKKSSYRSPAVEDSPSKKKSKEQSDSSDDDEILKTSKSKNKNEYSPSKGKKKSSDQIRKQSYEDENKKSKGKKEENLKGSRKSTQDDDDSESQTESESDSDSDPELLLDDENSDDVDFVESIKQDEIPREGNCFYFRINNRKPTDQDFIRKYSELSIKKKKL